MSHTSTEAGRAIDGGAAMTQEAKHGAEQRHKNRLEGET